MPVRVALTRDEAVAHDVLPALRPLALTVAVIVGHQHAPDEIRVVDERELAAAGVEAHDVGPRAQPEHERERIAAKGATRAEREPHDGVSRWQHRERVAMRAPFFLAAWLVVNERSILVAERARRARLIGVGESVAALTR